MPSRRLSKLGLDVAAKTFEAIGSQQPATRDEYRVPPTGPWWHAAGYPLTAGLDVNLAARN